MEEGEEAAEGAAPLRTTQRTRNLPLKDGPTYLRLRLTRAGEAATRPFPAAALLATLDDSLRALYGSVGSGSVAYRLVHWAEAEREGVVAVESGGAERLRAAATLVTQARGETVALHVTAASPFLYSLAHDSRAFCSSLLDVDPA